ncbi:hypothetical protein SLS62_003642 [Diatrype stigma]|uniref:DUF6606 domain-containing protein n=1 Tax=Diatrype stigma TaxID=117547 RepID=A0AAN9V4I6_9PEZI
MKPSDLIILHIPTQNAGVFVHRLTEPHLVDQVLFEFFEASPKREAVLGAKSGAINWNFPGTAVHLPCSLLNDSDFIESLATFLEQASVESTKKLSEPDVSQHAIQHLDA